MRRPDSIINVNCSLDRMFRLWLEFTKPYHSLTPTECDFAAAFLRKRHDLSQTVDDQDALDYLVMAPANKNEIREKFGMTKVYFNIAVGHLRNKKFFVNEKINPRFIPDLSQEDGKFVLQLIFNINDLDNND